MNKSIVTLQIKTWIGMDVAASHYMGTIKRRGAAFDTQADVTHIRSQAQATQENKTARRYHPGDYDWRLVEAGEETESFMDKDSLYKAAIKLNRKLNPKTVLIVDSHSTAQLAPMIDGPKGLMKVCNQLWEFFDQNNHWDGTPEQEAQSEVVNDLWHYLVEMEAAE